MLFFSKQPGMIMRKIGGYLLGIGLIFTAVFIMFVLMKVDITLAFTSIIIYHLNFNKISSFNNGLFQSLLNNWPLLIFVSAGVLSWLIIHIYQKRRPNYFEISLAVFLLLQAILVSPPYKQYYAPWFLLAGYFTGYLGCLLAQLPARYFFLIVLATCFCSVCGSCLVIHRWSVSPNARKERSLITFMNKIALPSDRIIAPLPYHPIFRRDVFFGWVKTYDPDDYGTEYLCKNIPLLESFFTEEKYRQELEEHPPAFICLGKDRRRLRFYPAQNQLISSFIKKKQYKLTTLDDLSFAIRIDYYDKWTSLVEKFNIT